MKEKNKCENCGKEECEYYPEFYKKLCKKCVNEEKDFLEKSEYLRYVQELLIGNIK